MAKRVLVTGAGSGFGREAAIRLAERGHQVIAAVQNWPQASELYREVERRGSTLRVEKLDLTSEIDRQNAWRWEIDVLVANAAVGEAGPLAEMPMALLREVFEINVFATLALTQGFVRQMAARGSGRLLFVSSIAGLATTPFLGPYCASKHALEAIAEALHGELKPLGISVATINPGPYLTGFNDRMAQTWRNWYDPAKNFTRPEQLGALAAEPTGFEILPKGIQSDPEEIVQLYVDLVEADGGKFRNMLPKHVEDGAKKLQQFAWVREQ